MVLSKNSLKIFLSLTVLICTVFGTSAAHADQKGMTIIRDTEIENTLRTWSDPIFRAAGISPSGVNIILVQSDAINAFVAGGSNIFFYTGLIAKSENPGEVIGVMAHETGHIAGGHLIKTRDALERASYESIVGAILGIGAAIATGDGGAAAAITAGSGSMAQRRFLAHTRVHESSADQAALTFLEKAKINPSGLSSFMTKLKAEMYMPSNQQSEYVQTHPLVENRMDALQTRISRSAYKDQPYPQDWLEAHARMKAKLLGFINPAQVPWVYADRDKSVAARYARAIAAYRNNQGKEALAKIDDLLAQEPQNAYFHELKGQILMSFGRGKDAVSSYRTASKIMPDAPLLRIALAHSLIESGAGNEALKEAIGHLERAMREEPRSAQIHRFLATAYGKMGDETMAKAHLAEEAVLQRRFDFAKEQANAVLQTTKEGSKAWLKAKDVLSFIEATEKG